MRHAMRLLAGSVAALALAVGLVGCGGPYALECGSGVERDTCERVAAFGFDAANLEADRVHVEARSCDRYLDPVPPDARCWSVRMGTSNDFTTVAVAQGSDRVLFEATDLFPLDPDS